MSLPKTYEPQKYEQPIYKLWEDSGAFMPDLTSKKPAFSIIMPPPNANGKLHWGHAIGYTTEDIITRFKRMQGYKTLWLPGTDHAGIETQFVYERDVLAPQGQSRFDLGPEQFYADVMAYTKKASAGMIDQFRSMGFSADWSKLKFTLDEDIIDIVYVTFKQLHHDGLVYRGNRLINWCPRCQAAFADIELDREERASELYTLDYGPMQIATTRPETIFADVAVAVNPEDKRYRELVGKSATIPLLERPVPIITDSHVDPSFGSGALKITPGHDPNDYEIGKRHELPEISVIDFDGKLINVPEEFAGLKAVEARELIVKALEKANKLISRQSITHMVAVHDRCGTLIEPLISEQWFLRTKTLNQPVIKAIEQDEIKIHPRRFKPIALNWLNQEHDWCISRQIWWGIRIPVYYKTSHDPLKEPYIIAAQEEQARDYYGDGNYRAETDTFDTWFSSGQWPYATLMTTGNYEDFYPTSLMGTAREILHKWVTRMIMFGLYRTGQIPFKEVYLWGLVTDEHGKKMSKSKGNVIDPLEITGKYGTDALRLAGAISNTPGNDSPMSESRVIAMRNFNNKLWNVARFILDQLPANYQAATPRAQNLHDEWILHRLSQGVTDTSRLIESYRLNEAANRVYHLLWDDFADWYIEATKVEKNLDLLLYGLKVILKLAHPFVPFVTEAIWQELPGKTGNLIAAAWPEPPRSNAKQAAEFEHIKAIITEIRTLKAELGLGEVALYYHRSADLENQSQLITQLAGLSACEAVEEGRGLPLTTTSLNCWLGVDHETVRRYLRQLATLTEEAGRYQASLRKQLDNKGFRAHASKEVVNATKERLKAATERLDRLEEQLERLKTV